MRRFVNFLCTHLTNNSADYVTPSSKCYQYFNDDPMYDLLDYCRLLVEGPYKDSQELRAIYADLKRAIQAAQVHHAYALDHTGLKVDYPLSYSVTLGAKMADDNKPAIRTRGYHKNNNKFYYLYNVEDGDQLLYWDGETTYDPKYSENKPYQSFANTYYKTEFDKKVGWSRIFKLNPYFPKNNPPTDDEDDHLRGTSLIHF
jgi:hypothetical protein